MLLSLLYCNVKFVLFEYIYCLKDGDMKTEQELAKLVCFVAIYDNLRPV